ncbi:MAG: glycosyltransferase family 39 protein [Acidobacteriota bacterium]|jgi:hypothetical protein|nr:glycosyltransferase family 39 protein [Acidobacteriota bacterium]
MLEHIRQKYKVPVFLLVASCAVIALYLALCELSVGRLTVDKRIFVPIQMQKTVTVGDDHAHSENFLKIKDILIADDARPHRVYVKVPDADGLRFINIHVSKWNHLTQNAGFSWRGGDGRFSWGDVIRFDVKDGYTTLHFPDGARELCFDFGTTPGPAIKIEQCVFSEFPSLPSHFLPLFIGLSFLIVFMLYGISFAGFGHFLSAHPTIVLFAVIVLQMVYISYWHVNKRGWHIDEIYSLMQSNDAVAFHDFKFNEWLDGKYFADILSVQSDERWGLYADIYRKHSEHVHPPLHNFLLHTMYSFFPGTVNLRPGFVFNLGVFAVSMYLLYVTSKFVLPDNKALLPPLMFGFTSGAVCNVNFVRMYCLLSLFFIVLAYCVFRLMDDRKVNWKLYISVAIVVCIGFFVHYYFAVWAFIVLVITSAFLFWNKRFDDLKKLVCATGCGMVANLLIFPYAIRHILFEKNHGIMQGDNLSTHVLGVSMKSLDNFCVAVNQQLFGGFWEIYAIILLICLMLGNLKFSISNNRIDIEGKSSVSINKMPSVVLFLSVSLYILCISKIATFTDMRYIFSAYPLVMMSFICLLHGCLPGKICARYVFPVLLSFLFLSNFGHSYEGDMLYTGFNKSDTIAIAKSLSDIPAVIYCDYNNSGFQYSTVISPDLKEHGRSYIVPDGRMNDLLQVLRHEGGAKVVAYILSKDLSEDAVRQEIIQPIARQTPYNRCTIILREQVLHWRLNEYVYLLSADNGME